MKILAIETSCDETAVAILNCEGEKGETTYRVLGHALFSQASLHSEFGGVFPALAKREHAKNITPLLRACLEEAELLKSNFEAISEEKKSVIRSLLEREAESAEHLIGLLDEMEKPDIDAIAVTRGPGLEPALWVGINVARALALVWNISLIPTNHMEGHIISALAQEQKEEGHYTIDNIHFPLLALLISGGHTEFVLMNNWDTKEKIGVTRDDAVGESFDKVARMLSLPYPGGKEISRLAQVARDEKLEKIEAFPRPMLLSNDLDFSFSGLKTAVLYRIKDLTKERALTENEKKQIAREFEDAVVEVLVKKTLRALESTRAQTFAVGGGVAASTFIKEALTNACKKECSDISLCFPKPTVATDNAIMIGMASYYNKEKTIDPMDLGADGRLRY